MIPLATLVDLDKSHLQVYYYLVKMILSQTAYAFESRKVFLKAKTLQSTCMFHNWQKAITSYIAHTSQQNYTR